MNEVVILTPLHFLTHDLLFYYVQEIVVLILYHHDSLKGQLIHELRSKVKEISHNKEIRIETVELLKLSLYLLGDSDPIVS